MGPRRVCATDARSLLHQNMYIDRRFIKANRKDVQELAACRDRVFIRLFQILSLS